MRLLTHLKAAVWNGPLRALRHHVLFSPNNVPCLARLPMRPTLGLNNSISWLCHLLLRPHELMTFL